MKTLRAALLSVVPAILAPAVGPAMAATASCENLSSLSLKNAKIDLAKTIPAGDFTLEGGGGGRGQTFRALPSFCRVAATLRPSSDSDIKIEVWLPAGWNGKFQAVGNGGWAGTISYSAMATALHDGYATTSTDTGHTVGNGSFIQGHWEKMIDFVYRSEHEMTVQAKAIVAAFYGSGPKLSYWNGCSTGGRQGLMEAARYPADFDGIVAGDPANPRSVHDSWSLAVTTATHKDPASVIPDAKFSTIHKAALDACDALDGVKDGLIENPKVCHFDPQVLLCKGTDNVSCLTPAQVASAKLMMSPAKANGKDFYPGFEPGSEMGWAAYAGPTVDPRAADNFKYIVYRNPDWDWKTFNADKDLGPGKKADLIESVTTADISKFTGHDGKLIMYHGWADPQVSPNGTLEYYDRMQKALGSEKRAAQSVALFMVPGMGHCRGGEGATDTFDAVATLDQWVDKGLPPKVIQASHVENGKTTRTRPLCLYPQVARYKGTGNSDDAANFACTAP